MSADDSLDELELMQRCWAQALWEQRYMPAQPNDSPFILPSEQPTTVTL